MGQAEPAGQAGDLPEALARRLQAAAREPVLLVACDYDGTIAPLVDDPARARPHRETVMALRALSVLPSTCVAVISGRGLRDLAALSRLPEEINLIGSHGSEFDLDFAGHLTAGQRELLARLVREGQDLAALFPGTRTEVKPASVAFHVRGAEADVQAAALEAVLAGPAALPGVHCRRGKLVIELAVVPMSKGIGLEATRHRAGATAVVFFGDDITDEDAFATLAGPDIGIKVGEGATLAPFRVDSSGDVARVLAVLVDARRTWLFGAGAPAIDRHSMLSDQRTVALVSTEGRVDWLCPGRPDSAALFAELIGGPPAGYFAVAPADGRRALSQRYLPGTLICETRWPTMSVRDYLDDVAGPANGATTLVRVLRGTGPARIEFAPRLDFGRVPTDIVVRDGGLEVLGSAHRIGLRAPGVSWNVRDDGQHAVAEGEVVLGADPLVLELRFGTSELGADARTEADRTMTVSHAWTDWASRLTLPSIESQRVLRSALTLKGLWYAPTGAFLAAATTSLPTHLGGIRNWDYRYCWLRDAAMSASALLAVGSTREALAFLDWVTGLTTNVPDADQLRPVYTVVAESVGPEAELANLPGYAGSRPVRIGNAAEHQVQLDVFGTVVTLADQLAERGVALGDDHLRMVRALAGAVERRWEEPDHGIWEIRMRPRNHVHSRVMCWQALDRAIALHERLGADVPAGWRDTRARIAADVLERGWKAHLNAYGAAYDGDDIGAASLHIILSGLLPPDDPRAIGTIHAVESVLRDGPTVRRYISDDGLPGLEVGWHLCAFWLVDALRMSGRLDEAWELFESIVALAGPTGLMAEQWDPQAERALGNFPQAYSHLGLILSAVALADVSADRGQPVYSGTTRAG